MTNVHYFPRYSQRENFATNNTLLLMHRLYDTSRHRFHRFLELLLVGKDSGEEVVKFGLQIAQQTGTGASVLDGDLRQEAVKIGIEAKNHAKAFTEDQIARHLAGFKKTAKGYLLLLSPTSPAIDEKVWRRLESVARKKNVDLVSLTFSRIIESFRECLRDFDGDLHELIEDFENYCSKSDLLDSDKTTMFVPPCGKSFEINKAERLYFCRSTWSRRKTGYIGFYVNKSVRLVGRVARVVHCELEGKKLRSVSPDGTIAELSSDERQRVTQAMHKAFAANGWEITEGYQFFLCDEVRETDFRKTSPSGIMGHRYFNLKDYGDPKTIDELAHALATKNWV